MLPAHHQHQVVLKSKNDYKIPPLLSFPSPPTSPRLRPTLANKTPERQTVPGHGAKKETKSKSYVEQFRIQALIREGKAKKSPVKTLATSSPPKIWNLNPAAKLPRRPVEVSEPVKAKIHRLTKTSRNITKYPRKRSVQAHGESRTLADDKPTSSAPALVQSKCDLSTTVAQVCNPPSQMKGCASADIDEPGPEDSMGDSTIVSSSNNSMMVPSENSNGGDESHSEKHCGISTSKTNVIRSTTSFQSNNLTMEVTLVFDSSVSKSSLVSGGTPLRKSNSAMLIPQVESILPVTSTQRTAVRTETGSLQEKDVEEKPSENKVLKDPEEVQVVRVAKSFIVRSTKVPEATQCENQLAQLSLPEPPTPTTTTASSIAPAPTAPTEILPDLSPKAEESSIVSKEIQQPDLQKKERESTLSISEPHALLPSQCKGSATKEAKGTPSISASERSSSVGKSEKISRPPEKSSSSSTATPSEKGDTLKSKKHSRCEDCGLRKEAVTPSSVTERGKMYRKVAASMSSKNKNKSTPTPPAPQKKRPIFRKAPRVEKPELIFGPLNKCLVEGDKMAPALCRSSVFEIPSRENMWQKAKDGYLSFSNIILLYKVGQRMGGILRLTNHSSQGVFFRVSSSCDFPNRYTLDPKEGKLDPYKRVLIKLTTEAVMEEKDFREDIFKIETVMTHATIYTSSRRFWMTVDPCKISSAFTSCIILYHPRDPFFRACFQHSKGKLKQFVDLRKGTVLRVTLKEILEDIEVAQKELDTIRTMELVNLAISICIALLSFLAAWYHLFMNALE
jgi:hypothetical protein